MQQTLTSKPIKQQRLPGLDVIRGIAISLVLLRHAFPSTFGGGGIVGVVIFFALSGYLITGVLDREVTKTGRISYRNFYRNRLLRLGPALGAILVVFTIVELLTNRLDDRHLIVTTIAVALTYTADLPVATFSSGLQHLWTLAVEEQFYLFWPTLFVFFHKRMLLNKILPLAIILLIAIAAISAIVLHSKPISLYSFPLCWASTLVIGASAYVWRDKLNSLLSGNRAPIAAAIGALFILGFSVAELSKTSMVTYTVCGPLIALSTAMIIVYVSRWEKLPFSSLVLLQWLGTISYAAYLWNYLILNWLTGPNSPEAGTLIGIASVVLTLIVATFSWRFVEKPALRLKHKLSQQ